MRRFSHRSHRDLSALAHFVDTHISEDLADHSPEERIEVHRSPLRAAPAIENARVVARARLNNPDACSRRLN
jgi:hypothetical protein